MAKNMSELVAEIKAIMAAKEALVTAGLMTEAESCCQGVASLCYIG